MIGMIEPVELTTEEKRQIGRKIASANLTLAAKADNFGFGSAKELRQEWLRLSKHKVGRGLVLFDEETRSCLALLQSLEHTILAGFIKMVSQIAFSFHHTHKADRPHLDDSDYLQEATWAIFDAIYYYDGSTEMSTYFYSTVKRRLAGFVRSEEIHSGIGRDIKKLRKNLRSIMRDKMCSVEVAVQIMRETVEISDDTADNLRSACYHVRYIGPEHEVSVEPKETEEPDEFKALMSAVRDADLNEIQREMIEHFLRTGERLDNYLVKNCVNPNTGKPYTRQAVSQQWAKAIDKLRLLMGSEEMAEAA